MELPDIEAVAEKLTKPGWIQKENKALRANPLSDLDSHCPSQVFASA